jgi:endonuclease YncB( thermonuclease family)
MLNLTEIKVLNLHIRLTILFLLAIMPVTVFSDIYQWTDKQGRTHYSAIKRDQAKRLTINPGYAFFQVKKIYDGDTILLENGTKVRLLGVNSPEVEYRNKLAQPFGEEAKQWLKEVLQGEKVRLEQDVEKKDKYGRTLAHVFTQARKHINLELVKKGLATVNVHPPGVKYTDELLLAQNQAEANKIGIWQHEQYHPKSLLTIDENRLKGWQRLFGEVINFRESRKYVYLVFSKLFDVRIAKKNLTYFPDISEYVGKTIEVRGWLSRRKKHRSMLIRHPSAIRVIPEPDPQS